MREGQEGQREGEGSLNLKEKGWRSAEPKDVIKEGCLEGRHDLVDSKVMVDEASVKRIAETIA